MLRCLLGALVVWSLSVSRRRPMLVARRFSVSKPSSFRQGWRLASVAAGVAFPSVFTPAVRGCASAGRVPAAI